MVDQSQMEKALKNSLGIDSNDVYISFLNRIFFNLSEAILITKSPKKDPEDFQVVYANPAFLRLTGYHSDEISLKNPFAFLSPLTQDKMPFNWHSSDIEDKDELQLLFHRKNGEPFMAQLTTYAIENPSWPHKIQVQTYKELTYELLLMESQQKYKSLFDNHPDGVFALDLDGKFTSVNSTCEALTGFSKRELLNMTFRSLLSDDNIDLNQKILDKSIRWQTNKFEVSLKDKNGKVKTLCITTIPIHVENKIEGIYGIAQDISQTKIQSRILNIEKKVLENIVGGKDLEPTLNLYLKEIESLHPSLMLTIMLVNQKETHLDFFIGSSLPAGLSAKLKEVPIEEGAGACGTSGFLKRPVIVPDVQQHPYMKDYFNLAKTHTINACWSYPIFSSKGNLLGTFAVYKHTEGYPDEDVGRIIQRAGNIISILIENKQNEQSYKQLNERFKLAMDVSNEAIWDWDIKNNILQWGSGFEIIFGYPLEEIEVTLEWWSFNIHPEDKTSVLESLEKALASKYNYWTNEYRYKAADGEYRYVVDRGNIIRDKQMKAVRMVGAIMDLTERKTAEETIRESEEQFRSLADSTLEGIVIVRKDKILDYNKAFALMIGFEGNRESIIGKSYLEFMVTENLAELKKSMEASHGGFYDVASIKTSKTSIPVELRAVKSIYKGQAATTISFRDISERIKIEKELFNYASELSRSNAELEQFAYMASHDLQEPLRMVTSFLQLLSDKYKGQFDDNADQYIAYAMDGAERMKILIKDLLKYSKISFQDEEKETIDLNELLSELRAVFSDKIQSEGGVLEVEEMPIVVGQKTLFSQLFQNLIGNGLKYRKKDPPIIKVKAIDRGTDWEFVVSDNGIGIDEKFHEKIFSIFQRLHSRDEFSGTGIGLAICKKIVEKYGGTIWVNSTPGKGSSFHFIIPKMLP